MGGSCVSVVSDPLLMMVAERYMTFLIAMETQSTSLVVAEFRSYGPDECEGKVLDEVSCTQCSQSCVNLVA